MSNFVRGSNPVWSLVDLAGKQLDDTYFLFVLTNTLPYLPAIVYHDINGVISWTNPIQFLANGTLPIDIFFDDSLIYRLEIRQGNTQDAPLIYLIENYSPAKGGSGPVDTVALATENQVTNAQFSLINFAAPYTLTGITNPAPINVAPGWFLNLAGTGNVTLDKVPLTGDPALTSVTNAPYALRITLSGTWTGTPYLSQRFNQSGTLWAGKYVSSSITTRIEGSPQSISARIDNSNGDQLTTVLRSTAINDTFNEYPDYGLMPAASNPNVPPAAWIEYKLLLPTSVDIYVTSFQLIAQDLPIGYPYEQDSIERQVDHTFHYYKDDLIIKPKGSILAGWQFGINPYQFRSVTQANLATFGYVCDQTIAVQQNYVAASVQNNISTGADTAANNFRFLVQSVTGANQFLLGQYINSFELIPYWGSRMSTIVKVNATKKSAVANLRVKMRLLYRADAIPVQTQTQPVLSWTSGQDPNFATGWNVLVPINDPAYNLANGANLVGFQWDFPANASTGYSALLVIYTIDNMDQSSSPDNLGFADISLTPGSFSSESTILTFNEGMLRCQEYYESSFYDSTAPTQTEVGAINIPSLPSSWGGTSNWSSTLMPGSLTYTFKAVKVKSPTMSWYNPTNIVGGTNNALARYTLNGSPTTLSITNFTTRFVPSTNIYGFKLTGSFTASTNVGQVLAISSTPYTGYTEVHFIADARLGL